MAKLYVAEYAGLAASGSGDGLINAFAVPPIAEQVIDSTIATGAIATLGAITAGAAYVNGQYANVPLTGGTGAGATANITVAGGGVTVVTLTNRGLGYTVADALSASNANLGGAGAGFSIPVATIAHDSAAFNPSTKFVEVSADAICSIAFSPPGNLGPVAAVTNMRLAAGERKQVAVISATNPANPQGALVTQQVSVITNT